MMMETVGNVLDRGIAIWEVNSTWLITSELANQRAKSTVHLCGNVNVNHVYSGHSLSSTSTKLS